MEPEWIDAIRALARWSATVPIGQLVADAATLVHLVGLSVAIATVLEVDWRLMRAARRKLRGQDAWALLRAHRRILGALLVLWTSGAVLAWSATGGDPNAASPKLAAKAVTVSLLTLTALAMGRYVLPTIVAHRGRRLLSLGLATRLKLATVAGLSGAGWVTALLIGASESLAPAPASVFAVVIAATHAGACVLAWTLAFATGRVDERRAAAAAESPETPAASRSGEGETPSSTPKAARSPSRTDDSRVAFERLDPTGGAGTTGLGVVQGSYRQGL